MNKNFKKAFTLSEVLITVGIIGVVAAVTTPTVVANYRKQTYVTQLRKISYEIEQAADLYMTDHSVNNLNRLRTSAELQNFITNYFKVVKNCNSRYLPCFAEEYHAMNGAGPMKPAGGLCNVTATFANGASICADSEAMEPIENPDDPDNPIHSSNTAGTGGEVVAFEVDINGRKGPNIYGRDYFTFELYPNGSIGDKYFTNSGADFDTQYPGNGMFGKIVEDGWKMNY